MADRDDHIFYGKLLLKGILRCETGLHIGASKEIIEIGGVDNPVMRDPRTGYPYIPGSSIKGKLRSIAERLEAKTFNRSTGKGMRHECSDRNCKVCRLFGSTAKNKDEENMPSRLRVRDAFLTDESKEWLRKIDTPLSYSELKYENALDRLTCEANPRSVERIPAGAEFTYEVTYDLDNAEQCETDLELLLNCMSILEDDYLGGHGTRGYGKISFCDNRFILRSRAYYLGDEEEKLLEITEEKEEKVPLSINDLRKNLKNLYQSSIQHVFREGV